MLPCSALAGNMHDKVSHFLQLSAYPQMTVKMLQILLWGMQINCSEQVNLQVWDPWIMRICSVTERPPYLQMKCTFPYLYYQKSQKLKTVPPLLSFGKFLFFSLPRLCTLLADVHLSPLASFLSVLLWTPSPRPHFKILKLFQEQSRSLFFFHSILSIHTLFNTLKTNQHFISSLNPSSEHQMYIQWTTRHFSKVSKASRNQWT